MVQHPGTSQAPTATSPEDVSVSARNLRRNFERVVCEELCAVLHLDGGEKHWILIEDSYGTN